jgi:plastocyanin
LIDRSGKTQATLVIKEARAVDWEDIASFRRGTHNYLLIGDVGDNAAKRRQYTLYVVEEPRIDTGARPPVETIRPFTTVSFTYEDGPHNCDSLAVDATDGTVYLGTRDNDHNCKVYQLFLPMEEGAEHVVARMIAELDISRATAMDISPDGRRAVVLTYGNAYEYTRSTNETWGKAFARKGRVLAMPRQVSGESICYGADGKTLYLTSEHTRQPIWEVPAGSSLQAVAYGPPRQIGILTDRYIRESSGLARSLFDPDAFWTHNDSGDVPRLFLLDRNGKTLATLVIEGAQTIDWEDMASFKRGTYNYLLIGDVGDNFAQRHQYTLYIIEEPRIARGIRPSMETIKPFSTISFTYEDGPHNCEAVAVDATDGAVYLVSKEDDSECKVYRLFLPMDEGMKQLVARMVARLDVSRATAMDISPDGRRAIVLTYGEAYEYTRGTDETWIEAFARKGRVLTMPERVQGESICYGADGKTLYLTSEHASQPLWEIPAVSNIE